MGKIMRGYKYHGKWQEKEVEDPNSLYKKQVDELVGEKNIKNFDSWIRGQGCPVMSDGSLGFFKWDVQKFLRTYVHKTILVTGGCGFIGTNLLKYLEENYWNYDIVNVDKMTYASKKYKTDDPFYKFYKVDICDYKELKKVFVKEKPDYVLHLAAESHVDNSIKNSDPFIQTNIIGTHNLLKLCQDKNIRFHYVNTDEVYGQLGPNEAAFDNTTKWNPRSPYSASKAAGAHLAMSYYHTHGLPVTISQCSNNYGPHQHKEKLIPKAILSNPIPVYGKGEQVRDWIYVEDHCRALVDILLFGEIGKSYNIGGENELRNIDLVKMIQKEIKGKKIQFVEDRKGHDFRYAIKTDYKPQKEFKEGLKETIEWYIKNN